ncbi:MAG: hypothetical protein ABR985_21090 [Methanotrichaceae archaeon]|jgi:hypothetical protein
MNEKKKEYLQDKLNKTIEKSQLQVRGGLKEYSFDEDGVKKVLELLLKEDSWTEKFSERFLEEKLKEIIMKALDEGNTQNVTNYLNDLITELGSYSLEQVVYIPLFGIKMSVPEKRIGNIIIKYMDEAKCIDLIQKTSSGSMPVLL